MKEIDDFNNLLDLQKFTDLKRRLTANEKFTADRFKECQDLSLKHRDNIYKEVEALKT